MKVKVWPALPTALHGVGLLATTRRNRFKSAVWRSTGVVCKVIRSNRKIRNDCRNGAGSSDGDIRASDVVVHCTRT